MELILEVVSHLGSRPSVPLSARFDEKGGSIGRRADNTLVLHDEEKIIGRNHGNIHYEHGVFIYTDNSLNGTELCGKDRVLIKDSAPLADGDRLKIGEYELQVRIEGLANGPVGLSFDLDSPQPSFPADIDIPSVMTPGFSFDDQPSPWADGGLASGPAYAPGFSDRPEAPPIQGHFTPPLAQQIPENFSFEDWLRENHGAADTASSGKQEDPTPTEDWMKEWAGGQQVAQPAGPVPPMEPALVPGQTDMQPTPFSFEMENRPLAADGGISQTPPHGDAGRPPLGEEATRSLSAEEIRQAGADRQKAIQETAGVEELPPPSPSLSDEKTFATIPPPTVDIHYAQTQLTPARAVGDAQADVSVAGLNMPKPGRPATPSVVRPAPSADALPASAPAVSATPAAQGGGTEPNLFQCFLDGTGLAEFPKLTPEEQAEAMKTLGLVFRHMVDGMMAVLQARAEEKSVIGADITRIQKDKNNPLKSFPTVEITMNAMLHRKYTGMGYVDSVTAIQEGFDDIMNHQLAMRAAMQASMGQILNKFDPAAVEKSVEGGGMFHSKKAKCWDAYSEAYPNLVREAMEGLFGGVFVDVYEEQVRKLRQARGKS